DVVADAGESAIDVGRQPHALDGGCAIADEREHLLSGDGELDGAPLQPLCREYREDLVWVRSALGPESAADVGRDHTHTVGGEPEHRGYGLTDRVHTLR